MADAVTTGDSAEDGFLAFAADGDVRATGTASESGPVLLTNVPAPWLAMQFVDKHVAPLVRLHNEILSFVEYITPTVLEYKTRDIVLSELTNIAKDLWPEAKVTIFGSQLTRILTPTSDLDLAILNVPEPKGSQRSPLDVLGDAIIAQGNVTYCEVIHSAKVPIVKLDHKLGISVDICLNNDSGLHTGAYIKQMVDAFPPLRPLTMVLKVFLSQRRLNETYTGGIGSFVLSSLIVSFLQHRIRLSKAREVTLSWNLGSLLLDFLQLYGTSFNYVHTGISITNNGSYFEKRRRSGGEWGVNPGRPNMLSIENPMQPDLDMGRNSFQMPKIRRAFEHALQLLSAALANFDCDSYLSFFIRTDDPIFKDRQTNLLSTKGRVNQRFIEPGGKQAETGPAADDSDDEDNGDYSAAAAKVTHGGGGSDDGGSAPSDEPDGDLSFSVLADDGHDDYNDEEDEDQEEDNQDEEDRRPFSKRRRVGGTPAQVRDDGEEEGEGIHFSITRFKKFAQARNNSLHFPQFSACVTGSEEEDEEARGACHLGPPTSRS
jgi:non-canonical poly(A) RNA polymerase PAPD5/7